MTRQGRFRLAARVVLASAWAALLALAGLWSIGIGAQRLPALGRGWHVFGLTALCMGQFVFAALVADRLFPHASVRLAMAFEATAAVGFIAGLVVMAVWIIGGAA